MENLKEAVSKEFEELSEKIISALNKVIECEVELSNAINLYEQYKNLFLGLGITELKTKNESHLSVKTKYTGKINSSDFMPFLRYSQEPFLKDLKEKAQMEIKVSFSELSDDKVEELLKFLNSKLEVTDVDIKPTLHHASISSAVTNYFNLKKKEVTTNQAEEYLETIPGLDIHKVETLTVKNNSGDNLSRRIFKRV